MYCLPGWQYLPPLLQRVHRISSLSGMKYSQYVQREIDQTVRCRYILSTAVTVAADCSKLTSITTAPVRELAARLRSIPFAAVSDISVYFSSLLILSFSSLNPLEPWTSLRFQAQKLRVGRKIAFLGLKKKKGPSFTCIHAP